MEIKEFLVDVQYIMGITLVLLIYMQKILVVLVEFGAATRRGVKKNGGKAC